MVKTEELTNPKSCMSRAGEHEMTFVLLARDAAAPEVIRFWVRERIRLGKNDAHDNQILEALHCANFMEQQRTDGIGLPDSAALPGTVEEIERLRNRIRLEAAAQKLATKALQECFDDNKRLVLEIKRLRGKLGTVEEERTK